MTAPELMKIVNHRLSGWAKVTDEQWLDALYEIERRGGRLTAVICNADGSVMLDVNNEQLLREYVNGEKAA